MCGRYSVHHCLCIIATSADLLSSRWSCGCQKISCFEIIKKLGGNEGLTNVPAVRRGFIISASSRISAKFRQAISLGQSILSACDALEKLFQTKPSSRRNHRRGSDQERPGGTKQSTPLAGWKSSHDKRLPDCNP